MSTHVNDLAASVAVHSILAPSVRSAGIETGALDMIAADGACFAIQSIGAISEGNTWTGAIEESGDGSTWVSIEGAEFAEVEEGGNTQVIRFRRSARYLRYVGEVSGDDPSVPIAVLIGQQRKTF